MIKNILTTAIFALTLSTISITAEASSMIELIEVEQQVQIINSGNTLRVYGANGKMLEVYDIAGVKVMNVKIEGSDKIFDLNLPKGCYIVKIGKKARKISVA